jgi:hypothetical protein
MKFVTSLKFLVLLIVALSVFTKRVKRSSTASKVLTRLDSQGEAKSYCYINDVKTISDKWLEINTASANSGKSGITVRNYYKNQSFQCGPIQKIANSDGKSNYFISYRVMNYWGAGGAENGWGYMRAMDFFMGNAQIRFLIDKKVFGDDINEAEMKAMIGNVNENRLNYMTRFRKYRNEMITKRTNAESLTALQAKRITTKDQLKAEIANKQIEVASTTATLKDLDSKAEASRLQIRNFEKEQNIKKTDKLDPAMQTLKELIQNLDALKAQKADNTQKINGIVPINSNDLAKSNADLKANLALLQATYMASDPKNAMFSTLLANFDAQRDTIPTVIA